MDVGFSEAEEYPGDIGGFEEKYDGGCTADDPGIFGGLRACRIQ